MKVVELIEVYKIYRTEFYEVRALDGITMGVSEGEFLAIMGPSGSGKSTLLNLIGCLDRPTKGKVIINGTEISDLSDRELTRLRRDVIGFIFQQYNLIPALTALENIELPMIFRGVEKEERRKRAMELLATMGLERLADRKPNEMSGGQQQRVAIARALANRPKILLGDEPTGNLDSKTEREIMELLRRLNDEERLTVILVTHNQSLSEYADRVVKIRDGKVVNDVS